MRIPVSIRVDSTQTDPDGRTDRVTAEYSGALFEKDGKSYISYTEDTRSEGGAVTKCLLKISDKKIELNKNGVMSYNMVFEEGKKDALSYRTAYGLIPMTLETYSLDVKRNIDMSVNMAIGYNLDMGGGYVLKCEMKLDAEPI